MIYSPAIALPSWPVLLLVAAGLGALQQILQLSAVYLFFLNQPLSRVMEMAYAIPLQAFLFSSLFGIAWFFDAIFGRFKRSHLLPHSTQKSLIARYFLRPGASKSLAICRIALFASMLFIAQASWNFFGDYGGIERYLSLAPGGWRSFSVLRVLFGEAAPSPVTVSGVNPVRPDTRLVEG